MFCILVSDWLRMPSHERDFFRVLASDCLRASFLPDQVLEECEDVSFNFSIKYDQKVEMKELRRLRRNGSIAILVRLSLCSWRNRVPDESRRLCRARETLIPQRNAQILEKRLELTAGIWAHRKKKSGREKTFWKVTARISLPNLNFCLSQKNNAGPVSGEFFKGYLDNYDQPWSILQLIRKFREPICSKCHWPTI